MRAMYLKNKLDELRKLNGLTQEEFAKELRVSRQTVSAIENGKYNPSLELAFEIALYFNMTIEEIYLLTLLLIRKRNKHF